MKIYKYNLPIMLPFPGNMKFELELPKDSEVLSTHLQNNKLMVWALVHEEVGEATETWKFEVVGTGFECSSPNRFIGTVLMHFDQLVLHVFALCWGEKGKNL